MYVPAQHAHNYARNMRAQVLWAMHDFPFRKSKMCKGDLDEARSDTYSIMCATLAHTKTYNMCLHKQRRTGF